MFTLKNSIVAVALVGALSSQANAAPSANTAKAAEIGHSGLVANGATFNGVKFQGRKLNGATFNGVKFQGKKLNGATFNGQKLNGATFNGRIMQSHTLSSGSQPGNDQQHAKRPGYPIDKSAPTFEGGTVRILKVIIPPTE